MSYDFWLQVPNTRRGAKKKGGPTLEQLLRLQRAREILQAYEPDIALDMDEGMFVARSPELGDVFVEVNRITLGMSAGAQPFSVYNAIHGLLKRFYTEDYIAVDPQVDGAVHYRERFVDFVQQYRHQFDCTDEEFAIWSLGGTPQAWIDRAATFENGGRIAAEVMPRGFILDWTEYRALSDEALWKHLQEVIARNDEAIAAHGLGAYMQASSEQQRSIFQYSTRRLSGLYYPGIGTRYGNEHAAWMSGSLLHYESTLLGELRSRKYPPAALDQPQRLSLLFALDPENPFCEKRQTARMALVARVNEVFRRSGQAQSAGGSIAERAEYQFYGGDADAMYLAIADLLAGAPETGYSMAVKRYGDFGAREVEVSVSECRSRAGA